jgi:hypothetical protein
MVSPISMRRILPGWGELNRGIAAFLRDNPDHRRLRALLHRSER